MKTIKFFIINLLLLVACMQVNAQKEEALLGKWKVENKREDFTSIVEFRKEENVVIGYCIEYAEKGEIRKDNSKVHSNILFDGKNGKTIYKKELQGGLYKMKGRLKMENRDLVKVTYTYGFFKFREVWTRIK
ncbi:hypothetical protein [uncultured Draconibacterium sp.]|uniref:hypothetical protein n=1 Tax=uncultured Draconibacterium sp. TaxID=1573823 RepID=UPI0025EB4AC6|nr:hypothetical protein [uncultured Draconibacterium sp.]